MCDAAVAEWKGLRLPKPDDRPLGNMVKRKSTDKSAANPRCLYTVRRIRHLGIFAGGKIRGEYALSK